MKKNEEAKGHSNIIEMYNLKKNYIILILYLTKAIVT